MARVTIRHRVGKPATARRKVLALTLLGLAVFWAVVSIGTASAQTSSDPVRSNQVQVAPSGQPAPSDQRAETPGTTDKKLEAQNAGDQKPDPQKPGAQKPPEQKPTQPEKKEEAQSEPQIPKLTEEVTVTARKRDETEATVPIALAALSGDELLRADIRTVGQMSQEVPGLNVSSDATSRAFVSVRGIGTALFNSVQPGVGIFLDGVYLPSTAWANNPMFDIQHVEVLKGPQGTMYGRNTLGGAINIITAKPTDTVRSQVTLDAFHGDGSYDATAWISGPIVPGKLRGRFAATERHSDGFYRNSLIGGQIDRSMSHSFNGSVMWQIAKTADLTVGGYYLKNHGPETAYGWAADIHDYSDDIYKLNVSPYSDSRYRGGNATLSLDLPSARTKVKTILARDEQHQFSAIDADFTAADVYRQSGTDNRNTNTVEVRFDTAWTPQVSTLIGVFWSGEKENLAAVTTVVPYSLDVPAAQHQTDDSVAVFGTLFYRPSTKYEFTAGFRYNYYKATLDDESDATHPHREFDNTHVEPRISATRFWSPQQMTYASFSTGHREGGFNQTVVAQHLWIIRPDKIWTVEAGQKMSTANGRSKVNLSVFYSDYTDFIGQNTFVLRPDGLGYAAAVVNEGDARSYGVEFDGSHRLTDRWTVSGDFSYVHMRSTNQNGWIAATGSSLCTDRLIFQPDWTFNARTEYAWSVGRGWLSLRAGIYGKGSAVGATQKAAGAAPPVMDSYYLVNAGVSYTIKKVQFSVLATNLTNTSYWSSYIDDSELGHSVGIQAPKRRVGAQMTVFF
jgi:iron complex outermembrane receptor protein